MRTGETNLVKNKSEIIGEAERENMIKQKLNRAVKFYSYLEKEPSHV